MKKSRILYAVWLCIVIAYFIFSTDYTRFFLLAFSVLLPVILLVMTWEAFKKLEVSLKVPVTAEKKEASMLEIRAEDRNFLPLDRVICRVKADNLLTGEILQKNIRLSVPGKQVVLYKAELKEEYCGELRVTITEIICYDPFGLWKFRRKSMESGQICIKPETFASEVQIIYGESMNLDSSEYSMKKAGFDPSETFAIRDYRPGDSPHQIHWKLSEKMGDLVVRDYGLPVQNTILLLLETGRYPESEKPLPKQMDALAESFLSVSQELAGQQIPHSIGWQNHETDEFSSYEIGGIEDLMGIMPEIMGAAAGEDAVSVLGHFLERSANEFAHVCTFSTYALPEAESLGSHTQFTEFLCEKEAQGTYAQGNIRAVSFSPETMAEDLAYVEI